MFFSRLRYLSSGNYLRSGRTLIRLDDKSIYSTEGSWEDWRGETEQILFALRFKKESPSIFIPSILQILLCDKSRTWRLQSPSSFWMFCSYSTSLKDKFRSMSSSKLKLGIVLMELWERSKFISFGSQLKENSVKSSILF